LGVKALSKVIERGRPGEIEGGRKTGGRWYPTVKNPTGRS